MVETDESKNESANDLVLPLYWAATKLVDIIRSGDDANGYAEMLSNELVILERVLDEIKRVCGSHSHFEDWHKRRYREWEYYASHHGYVDKLQSLGQEAEEAAKLDVAEFDTIAKTEFDRFIKKDN